MPELGVYLVKPASRAAMAAALMCSGVSKSGSPAPKPQTSIPSDFIAFALLSMERVRDGVKLEALEESCIKDCFRTTWPSRSFQPRNSARVAKHRAEDRRQEKEERSEELLNRRTDLACAQSTGCRTTGAAKNFTVSTVDSTFHLDQQ